MTEQLPLDDDLMTTSVVTIWQLSIQLARLDPVETAIEAERFLDHVLDRGDRELELREELVTGLRRAARNATEIAAALERKLTLDAAAADAARRNMR